MTLLLNSARSWRGRGISNRYSYLSPVYDLPLSYDGVNRLQFDSTTGRINSTTVNTTEPTWATVDSTLTDSGNAATNTTNLQAKITSYASSATGNVKIVVPIAQYSGSLTLKSNATGFWIGLVTAGASSLPTQSIGTGYGNVTNRVSPLHASYMPNMNPVSGNTSIITHEAGAAKYFIRGFNFTNTSLTLQQGQLINLYSYAPTDITISQCLFDGGSATYNLVTRAVRFGGTRQACVDSYFDRIGNVGNDAQAMLITSGAQFIKITNTYSMVGASSENIMSGGVQHVGVVADLPHHVEIRGNYFDKPVGYGSHKNYAEVKWGKYFLIEGNTGGYHNGLGQQHAYLINCISNGTGDEPYLESSYIHVRNNRVSQGPGGINFASSTSSGAGTHHIDVQNNLVARPTLDGVSAFRMYTTIPDANIQWNTFIGQESAVSYYGTGIQFIDYTADIMTRVNIRYNIIAGSETGFPMASTEGHGFGQTAFNYSDNGTGSFVTNLCNSGTSDATYTNQIRVNASLDSIGFIDMVADNWALTNSSAGHAAGPDGHDIGCNTALLNTILSNVESTGLYGNYSAAIKRYDGGTGLANVYGSIMFAPGVVTSSADLSKVRITIGINEPSNGIYIALNEMYHADGSYRSARVHFQYNIPNGSAINARVRIGSNIKRYRPDIATPPNTIDFTSLSWHLAPVLFAMTDATYICTSRFFPLPMVPRSRMSLEMSNWLDNLYGPWNTDNIGSSAYDEQMIPFYKWAADGDIDACAQAIRRYASSNEAGQLTTTLDFKYALASDYSSLWTTNGGIDLNPASYSKSPGYPDRFTGSGTVTISSAATVATFSVPQGDDLGYNSRISLDAGSFQASTQVYRVTGADTDGFNMVYPIEKIVGPDTHTASTFNYINPTSATMPEPFSMHMSSLMVYGLTGWEYARIYIEKELARWHSDYQQAVPETVGPFYRQNMRWRMAGLVCAHILRSSRCIDLGSVFVYKSPTDAFGHKNDTLQQRFTLFLNTLKIDAAAQTLPTWWPKLWGVNGVALSTDYARNFQFEVATWLWVARMNGLTTDTDIEAHLISVASWLDSQLLNTATISGYDIYSTPYNIADPATIASLDSGNSVFTTDNGWLWAFRYAKNGNSADRTFLRHICDQRHIWYNANTLGTETPTRKVMGELGWWFGSAAAYDAGVAWNGWE